MESLALVVVVLLLIVLITGPLALGISFIPVGKNFSILIKRTLIGICTVFESLTGGVLIFSAGVKAAHILGIIGVSCAGLANYRVYRRR
jgi:hypothetical protein